MKKLLITSILVLIIISSACTITDKFSLLDYFSGQYFVYTKSSADSGIDLGFCHMSTSPAAQQEIIGESIKVTNFEPVSALKQLNAKLIKTEVLSDGMVVLYGYTKLIGDKVNIDNHDVNIQIACKDEYCIIGWPLILGSF